MCSSSLTKAKATNIEELHSAGNVISGFPRINGNAAGVCWRKVVQTSRKYKTDWTLADCTYSLRNPGQIELSFSYSETMGLGWSLLLQRRAR